ncbi:MAG TPA: NAD(P)/FAD-dependent oxidoreductase [bacterium]|nr:NAD(P)/FAD-dependent oxidoreductase [bacterium]
MENNYDVIIIGAGPAGLECANQLKDSNLSVLLIDKKEIIGPKTCAGGLTGLDKKFSIPNDKTRTFSKQIIFLENKKTIFIGPIKTIDRFDLGQYQLGKIENSENITVLKETLVKLIEKNRIITNRGVFYFKFLVGADGSSSIVRKYLGLKTKICIGLYYNISKVTDDFILYVNPKLLKSGYIWEFPHKKYTNIGVYFNPEYLTSKQAKEALENYLRENNYNFSSENFNGAPISYNYKGCIFNNIFLVGDAAGLASKITGEGIAFALTSGEEIARKILNPDYKMIELQKILVFKKRQEIMLKIFDTFSFIQKPLFKIFLILSEKGLFKSYFG